VGWYFVMQEMWGCATTWLRSKLLLSLQRKNRGS